MADWNDDTYWNKQEEELRTLLMPLIFTAMEEAARMGIEMVFTPKKAEVGIDWSIFSKEVYDFAKRHTYDLVKGITGSTREFLRTAIPDWIAAGLPIGDLADTLAGIYGDYRAWSIAVTEVTKAYAEGNILAWKESGMVTGKKWQTAEDEMVCPICGPLHDLKSELDENGFSTEEDELGLYAPPAHVNCRCYLLPITRTP